MYMHIYVWELYDAERKLAHNDSSFLSGVPGVQVKAVIAVVRRYHVE
ncbi:MAG: hypothetical protein PVS3B1_13850 [Ktedonobacteraceae bacterium]